MRALVQILAILIYLGVASAGVPWVPEPQEQQDWMPWIWEERFQQNVNHTKEHAENINIIFYGDSITEGWNYTNRPLWESAYASLGAVNYGIGGDRTEHVLWRIINGEVDSPDLNPKLCVLKIGTNNMWINTDEDIARGVEAIVNTLNDLLPSMKILLLGILPRTNEEETLRTDNINSIIANLDNGDTIRFLNMRDSYYAGAGEFYTELYVPDLLHLSELGYTVWHDTMDSLFQEMWNSV